VVKKSAHPDSRLFDYLSGSLDAQSRLSVEEHLSACADCRAVQDLAVALKANAGPSSGRQSRIAQGHLSVSELASFFYLKSPRAGAHAAAAHVAQCQSCADELAEYARAERAAASYDPALVEKGEVPAAVWEMINEWEQSSFAKPKPASEAISQEMLAKLFKLLGDQKDWLRNVQRGAASQGAATQGAATQGAREDETPNLVPVIVVDRSGQLRGVEMFERVSDAGGESVLKHAEKSVRFDKKPVHALLDFGGESRVVVSDRIKHDTVRLQQTSRTDQKLRRADYFIIED